MRTPLRLRWKRRVPSRTAHSFVTGKLALGSRRFQRAVSAWGQLKAIRTTAETARWKRRVPSRTAHSFVTGKLALGSRPFQRAVSAWGQLNSDAHPAETARWKRREPRADDGKFYRRALIDVALVGVYIYERVFS